MSLDLSCIMSMSILSIVVSLGNGFTYTTLRVQ